MRPILKYYGGKWKHAAKIIKYFAPNDIYVEPFGGGANILLRKEMSKLEVYNDIYGDAVNFFRVLRDFPNALINALYLTPYARDEYAYCRQPDEVDCVERARRFYVYSWQTFMGGGCSKDSLGQWKRIKLSKPLVHNESDLWFVADRLRSVEIESIDAVECIEQFDTDGTLFYIDPPYYGKQGEMYIEKYDVDQHRELSECLHHIKGYCCISAIESDLYNDLYADFVKVEMIVCNAKSKNTRELLYMNYEFVR
jgi:DNA adenine methylase